MPAVKNVGEPCAGEPHARFDGGREETSASRPARAAPGASRLPDQPRGVRFGVHRRLPACGAMKLLVELGTDRPGDELPAVLPEHVLASEMRAPCSSYP